MQEVTAVGLDVTTKGTREKQAEGRVVSGGDCLERETEKKQCVLGEINQAPLHRSWLCAKQPGIHPGQQNGSNALPWGKTSGNWVWQEPHNTLNPTHQPPHTRAVLFNRASGITKPTTTTTTAAAALLTDGS